MCNLINVKAMVWESTKSDSVKVILMADKHWHTACSRRHCAGSSLIKSPSATIHVSPTESWAKNLMDIGYLLFSWGVYLPLAHLQPYNSMCAFWAGYVLTSREFMFNIKGQWLEVLGHKGHKFLLSWSKTGRKESFTGVLGEYAECIFSIS